ncbi:hypothetical protein DJ031_13495 [bacterium endosymbiont of Escarpia laminata]|nr:MAG: hypothetical protein DJ031_13495 [bacterium endosymbiont of Escarpia laminata]
MNAPQFQGARLRLARLVAGFSLAELGAEVGVSRQHIHQLETEERPPGPGMLEALSDAVGVLSEYFFRDIRNEVEEQHCNFRKLRTAPVTITKQVVARGTLFNELVSLLDEKLSLPPVDFPQFDVSSNENIEQAAEHCRDHWELTVDQPITNMIRVVERAGAVVTCIDGLSAKIDALSIDRARPTIVRSTAKAAPTRLRFDIAHECGHLVMHRGIVTGDTETEREANRFASAFLLPRRAFVREFPKKKRIDWKAMFEIKQRWKTSLQAIVRRAYDLGFFDAAQYRRANIYISKNGYRKSEPFDPEHIEQPELLKLSISSLEEYLGIQSAEFANQLGYRPIFLEKLIGIPVPEPRPVSEASNVISLF